MVRRLASAAGIGELDRLQRADDEVESRDDQRGDADLVAAEAIARATPRFITEAESQQHGEHDEDEDKRDVLHPPVVEEFVEGGAHFN